MKKISRSVKFHVYEFGKLDVEQGTVSVSNTVERIEPMSKRDIFRYTQDHDCVLVRERIVERAYTMSTAYFVECAKEYARQQQSQQGNNAEQ